MPEYCDIEFAIEDVSGAPRCTNRAVYDKRTARFLYASALSGESEIPDDLEWDRYIEMPHKHDLDLGQNLILRFIVRAVPNEEDTVRRIFSRRGAYGRFREFLTQRQLVQQWFDFEASATRKAIERWCKGKGMAIAPQGGSPDSSPAAGSESGDL